MVLVLHDLEDRVVLVIFGIMWLDIILNGIVSIEFLLPKCCYYLRWSAPALGQTLEMAQILFLY